MLSSRDTPFSEDGWALIIEDMRRLNLLIAGGANDLNAGAIDADQQAINNLSTALTSHEIDPAAHAALLAGYLLRSDYTAATSPVDFYAANISAAGPLVGAGYWTALTGWSATSTSPTGTLTGFNLTTGVFAPPASGVYAFSFGLDGTPSSAASHVGLGIFGTFATSQASNFDTANTTGADRTYHESVTLYVPSTTSVTFSWGSGANWTNYTFSLIITRIT